MSRFAYWNANGPRLRSRGHGWPGFRAWRMAAWNGPNHLSGLTSGRVWPAARGPATNHDSASVVHFSPGAYRHLPVKAPGLPEAPSCPMIAVGC